MKDAIWPVNGHDWIESPAVGLSGGLLVSWNSSIINKVSSQVAKNLIWFWGTLINDLNVFNIFNIYAPHDHGEKKSIFDQISSLIDQHSDEPFCIIGDFNSIRNANERSNCTYRNKDSEVLEQLIQNCNLWEVPLTGKVFTWFGPGNK